jgi:hypothetical protein
VSHGTEQRQGVRLERPETTIRTTEHIAALEPRKGYPCSSTTVSNEPDATYGFVVRRIADKWEAPWPTSPCEE